MALLKPITYDEFLQMKQNQSWHSRTLSIRELWYYNNFWYPPLLTHCQKKVIKDKIANENSLLSYW